MRHVFTLFAFFLSLGLFSQNFAPFKKDVAKRFVEKENTTEKDYFFYSMSDTVIGDSLIFNQYFTVQQSGGNVEGGDKCDFYWGGSKNMLDTTWLGLKVVYDQKLHVLLLKNEDNRELKFNFGIELNDSSLFYEDESSKYFIKYESLVDSVVFEQQEKVKLFKILIYDLEGNLKDTTLSSFEIKLGENLGLLSFIDCYNFPNQQKGVSLMGQTNPLVGDYQLSMYEAYPWAEGDIIQYKGVSIHSPTGNYTKHTYEKLTIIARTETPDSVIIDFESDTAVLVLPKDTFPKPPIKEVYIGLKSPIKFGKNDLVLKVPYNYGSMVHGDRSEFYQRETYECNSADGLKFYEEFSAYCDSCRCYVGVDGYGTYTRTRDFAKNYGLNYKRAEQYGPLDKADRWSVSQIYSKIDGVECGDEWVGLEELKVMWVKIYPVPSNGMFTIEGSQLFKEVRVTDLLGREVYFLNNIFNSAFSLDLSRFKKGSYLVYVTGLSGGTGIRHVIIQ